MFDNMLCPPLMARANGCYAVTAEDAAMMGCRCLQEAFRVLPSSHPDATHGAG